MIRYLMIITVTLSGLVSMLSVTAAIRGGEFVCTADDVDWHFKNAYPYTKHPINVDFDRTVWKGRYPFENIELESEYGSNTYMSVTVAQGDHRGPTGDRAELSWDNNRKQGTYEYYSYKVRIPEDFEDSSLYDKNGDVNFQVIGQWHAQPVWEKCEHWDKYTGQSISPPAALYYSHVAENDPGIDKALNHRSIGPWTYTPDGLKPGKAYFNFSYGIKENRKVVAIVPIEKGKWYKMEYLFHWSQYDDGWVRLRIDGKEITERPFRGANMKNEQSNFFKIGMYRNDKIPYTNSVHYDDIKIKQIYSKSDLRNLN